MKRLLLTVLLCLLLAGCAPSDPNLKFIQGTWTAAGDQGEGHSWYLEWKFANGSFEMSGYPPIYQAGKYRMKASEGGSLTLELYSQSGDLPSDDRSMIILVDMNNETLTIDGLGPFSRSSP
jgi:hypothetical protein